MRGRNLHRDERGSSIVEFALSLPILAMLMMAILQFSLVLHASGNLRHALGEGIRHAKINPHLTDAQVTDYTRDRLNAMDHSGIASLTFSRGTQNGASFGTLSITYEMTPMIPFMPIEVISLSETKRAYLPA